MFKPANRLDNFLTYAFAKLDEAKQKASEKFKVIDMGVGDPDFPCDKLIKQKLIDAMDYEGSDQYPSYSGSFFFREAASRYLKNRFNIELDPVSEIIALIGSKEGIAHLPWAIINPGDIGAYTTPGYPVYKSSIAFAGGITKEIVLKEENDFLPDFDEIPDGTKIFFMNYPNNPTSASGSMELFEKAVFYARKKGFLLVNDASYTDVYFDKVPHSLLEVPGAKDCAIEYYSLSKSFSMTGWRIAFAAGNPDIIKYIGTVKKQIDSGQYTPIQHAAATALDNYHLSEGIREIYKKRVNMLRDGLIKTGKFENVFNSGATFYIWAKIQSNDTQFAAELLETAGILCLPGSYMGTGGDSFVRFSTTLPDEDIIEAVKRLEK